jgi:UDP-N-acetylmuramyl pentapeptide phosphotransferase/UDP-N-acetylglucosamine-1-phosphate transferase
MTHVAPTSLLPVFVLALTAGVLSYLIGDLVRRHAARLRLLDVPNTRSSHEKPTPRGGGLGIVCGTVGGMLLLPSLCFPIPAPILAALTAGGLIVAAVSLADDIGGLVALIRLLVHLGLGVGAVLLVGPVSSVDLGSLGTVELGWIATPITVVWMAGIINAYNFMDGIDGLAAGQAVATSAAWTMVGVGLGRIDLAAIGLLIGATSAGFLLHNWHPARLFMGDVGSAFLGYTLGLLVVIGAQTDPTMAVAGVVMLWPFVFDTAVTLVRRTVRRENILAAHRLHLYQRLVASGWSHRVVTSLYLALAMLSAALGIGLVFEARWSVPAAIFCLPAMVLGVWVLVRWREARALDSGT